MKGLSITSVAAVLPITLILAGCSGDDGKSTASDDDETGISSGPTGDGDGDGDGNELPGDGDGEGDGDGDSDDGPDCGSVSIQPKYTPPNVMLLVDASGSMTSNSWDHDLDIETPVETRWKTLHRVVDTIMGEFGPAMRAGVQRFPAANATNQYGEGACLVAQVPEVGVALDNAAAILAAIPGPDAMVVGGTPATRGFNSVVNHLKSQPADISRYILFITDGAANCTPGFSMPALLETYDETVEPTVAAALANDNITTFVVGIDIVDAVTGAGPDGSPEANAYQRLNDVALAGGAPKNGGAGAEKFFNSTNQDELLTALAEIIDEITECIIDLSQTDEGVPEANQIPYVSFEINGQPVPKVNDCETEDGWTWLELGVVVTFCGSYCDDFKGGGVMFDGTYGCPPLE